MRSFLNWFLSGFAILFAVPSFLILISWNALPGDRLYSLKTGLEDITLTLTLKTPLSSKLSVKYTDRRFSEASRLLSKKGSSIGYNLLVSEANQSKDIIVQNQDSKSAAELVAKIDNYQKNIEQKKIAIQTGGISIPTSQTATGNKTTTTTTTTISSPTPFPTTTQQTPAPTPYSTTPTPTPVSPVVTQTPPPVVNAQSESEVLNNLDETNKQLEDIKKQIEDAQNSSFHSNSDHNPNEHSDQNNSHSDNNNSDKSNSSNSHH